MSDHDRRIAELEETVRLLSRAIEAISIGAVVCKDSEGRMRAPSDEYFTGPDGVIIDHGLRQASDLLKL